MDLPAHLLNAWQHSDIIFSQMYFHCHFFPSRLVVNSISLRLIIKLALSLQSSKCQQNPQEWSWQEPGILRSHFFKGTALFLFFILRERTLTPCIYTCFPMDGPNMQRCCLDVKGDGGGGVRRKMTESLGKRRGSGWHNHLYLSLMRQLCLAGFYWSSSSHRLEPSVQPFSMLVDRILARLHRLPGWKGTRTHLSPEQELSGQQNTGGIDKT